MKILFYDIETGLLRFAGFHCGKQVVRHNQLLPGFSRTQILTIQYCYNDGEPAKVLVYDYKNNSCKDIIEQFDALIKDADIVIGKNSNRFDNKHLNSQRLWNGLPSMPDWIRYTEDLETQMRKYFYLPSYSLDYFSKEMGIGGKIKMEFDDWVDIQAGSEAESTKKIVGVKAASVMYKVIRGQQFSDIIRKGKIALAKMVLYGGKDVEDTRALWHLCEKHFETRIKFSTENLICKYCESSRIHKDGTRPGNGNLYQMFRCSECRGYQGRALIGKNGNLGKIL